MRDKDIAETFGVARDTPSKWRSRGAPTENILALARWVLGRQNTTKSAQSAAQKILAAEEDKTGVKRELPEMDYQEARTRKMILDAEKVAIQIEVLKGTYIPKDQLHDDMVRLGHTVKAGLSRLAVELPPACEGLTAAKMQGVIRDAIDSLLRDFNDMKSKLYENLKPKVED